jgi:hypothetical protein
MFKRRFLLGLATGSILWASLTISSFTMIASPLSHGMIGSLHQRSAVLNVTQVSSTYHLDCFKRYYKFNHGQSSTRNQQDASNFYLQLS